MAKGKLVRDEMAGEIAGAVEATKTQPTDAEIKAAAFGAEIAQVTQEVARLDQAKQLKEAFYDGRIHQLNLEKEMFTAEMAEAIRQGKQRIEELKKTVSALKGA